MSKQIQDIAREITESYLIKQRVLFPSNPSQLNAFRVSSLYSYVDALVMRTHWDAQFSMKTISMSVDDACIWIEGSLSQHGAMQSLAPTEELSFVGDDPREKKNKQRQLE